MRFIAPAALLLVACSSAPSPTALASRTASEPSPSVPETAAFDAPAAKPVLDEAVTMGASPPNPRSGLIARSVADRDPFRAYPQVATPPPPDTRHRKAHRFSVDQLKLVGLVTNTSTPRAVLVDPAGKGYVVTQGELVGSPEVVGGGDVVRYASFRVDRIREGDVVLVREDALDPRAPATTRVLALPRDPLLTADD